MWSGAVADARLPVTTRFGVPTVPVPNLPLLGRPGNVIDHRRWMDDGVVVIHDLRRIKDRLTRRIIGALLMVDIELAAMSEEICHLADAGLTQSWWMNGRRSRLRTNPSH